MKKSNFTFIDLFAGIGGMRLALEESGGECVFSSEWDRFCVETYSANFGEEPAGDITKINEKNIPPHDILTAGFPCQPFSLAGVSKKNSLGKRHGFLDETQGTLFFDIARILAEKRPKAFLLENVPHLKRHNKGKTYRVIFSTLEKLNYHVFDEILSSEFYVPQKRKRVFIVGFNKDYFPCVNFEFPRPVQEKKQTLDLILEDNVPEKYTLSAHLWDYLVKYAKKHREKGNGFGYGLVDKSHLSRTLSARYYKDGSEILICQGNNTPRRLTPRECARLMGFPDSFVIPVSDTQAYKQFGNAVVVPLVGDIARGILNRLEEKDENCSSSDHDVFTKEKRSQVMSKIGPKDTKPELLVRKWLHAQGFRYRKHVQNLPGKPDVVLPKYKTAVFVNGCFWHGHDCRYAVMPKTRASWWKQKISATIERDTSNHSKLREIGWQVLVVWECELHSHNKDETLARLVETICENIQTNV